ncbi:probable calcium-binding protein CML15 [Lingula anatina]|uniref:Probable calcium-binding protein CML15 n=1 Tax=Lingula anatina TaxID=7574 RepID=A0A1S3JVJ1_LINAN|nr:probable calcium-binding protein CML15 [Lingula anatina]|eukprot:XP_013414104.1 probable calcium-binding protein CML15 [Lingula anatina]
MKFLVFLGLIGFAICQDRIDQLFSLADANKDGSIQKAELVAVFLAYDEDSDGRVTETEFVDNWVAGTGSSQEAAKALFDLTDAAGAVADGAITRDNVDAVFVAFDADGSGEVSPAEFRAKWTEITGSLAATSTQVQARIQQLFNLVDKNGNGIMSQGEYFQLLTGFDDNKDNEVTQAEFLAHWPGTNGAQVFAAAAAEDGKITREDLQRIYNQYDGNGDGKVTREEFAAAWLKIVRENPAILG